MEMAERGERAIKKPARKWIRWRRGVGTQTKTQQTGPQPEARSPQPEARLAAAPSPEAMPAAALSLEARQAPSPKRRKPPGEPIWQMPPSDTGPGWRMSVLGRSGSSLEPGLLTSQPPPIPPHWEQTEPEMSSLQPWQVPQAAPTTFCATPQKNTQILISAIV